MGVGVKKNKARIMEYHGGADELCGFLFLFFLIFIYLFLDVLGLHCCVRVFSSCGSRALERRLSSCGARA